MSSTAPDFSDKFDKLDKVDEDVPTLCTKPSKSNLRIICPMEKNIPMTLIPNISDLNDKISLQHEINATLHVLLSCEKDICLLINERKLLKEDEVNSCKEKFDTNRLNGMHVIQYDKDHIARMQSINETKIYNITTRTNFYETKLAKLKIKLQNLN